MAKVKRVLGIIVILALLVGSSAPFFASMSSALAQDDKYESFTPELAEQLLEIYQQKQSLTPLQRKIDWSILKVIREVEKRISAAPLVEMSKFQDLSTPLLKVDDTGNIEVKLTVTNSNDEQLEQLEAFGMQIRLSLPEYGIIEGSLGYEQVEAVAGLDFVVNVGTPGYPLHRTGDVTSEGDTVLRAAEARTAFGVDGSGIKVGVISDGVTHLSQSVATGDLPSSPAVDVLKAGSDDEGTAILEIIHDLAPGASLAFYSPDTISDIAAGIAALEAADCDIIVDDLGFLWDEPKFEDGPVAQEARQFCTNGGVYVTACGNDAEGHYMATYSRDDVVYVDSIEYYAHDYGGGDIGNTFTIPNGGSIGTILQWNNQWGLSRDDFDLYLFRSDNLEILEWSINDQSGAYPDPREGLGWANTTGSSVTVFIGVFEYSLVNPPSSMILDYIVYDDWLGPPGLQYIVPENSVFGHAAVEEVLSTAAANAATPDTIESFSSCGPGTVYFPIYEERQVPNITGVDRVQTKTGQLGYFFNPFGGTSASAPHVAAIAALVWEANPMLTSSGVHNAITSTAVDLGPVGWDNTWGFGRVDAYEAVASVAAGPAPPSVTTNNATNITTNSATANGYLNNLGTALTVLVSFQYGLTTAYGSVTTPQAMTTTGYFNFPLTGLSPNTTYHFRAKAVGNGTSYGLDKSFTTSQPDTLSVTTNNANNITTNSATANGYLNNLGTALTVLVSFQYGLTTAYGSVTTPQAMTTTGSFNFPLTGLSPNTTYHFRAKAVGNGTSYGLDKSFTTSQPDTLSVTTNNATNITTNSATANGYLSNLGTASTVYVSFQYGLTTAYGSVTTPKLMTTTGTFNFPLTGLSPNTIYHFRAKAVGNGTSYGLDKSFTTSQPDTLSVTTNNATNITTNSATANGYLNNLGTASTVYASSEHGLTTVAAQTENPYLVSTFVDEDGNQIDVVSVPGRPPEIKVEAVEVPEPNIEMGINTLTGVPAFDWSYGPSATSAAMLFGYYDRTGYSNMYTGPTNGGVCPLDNSVWGETVYPGVTCHECPLSATHNGIDGRTIRGHVDDYWIDYLNPGPDPWIVNGWIEHTHGDCTGDFMGTNQSAVGNVDGETIFYYYTNGLPLYDETDCEPSERDGCHGMRLFAESCGYSVVTNFTQAIYGYNGNTLGFTFEQFTDEIDAGRPVLIQTEGNTMLGYGYNTSGHTVYIHNTWDHSSHQMPWGGTYAAAQHWGVTVIQLAPVGAIVYVSFQYGLTTAYGSVTTPQAMTTTGLFNFPLTGLSPNTTYHFRAKAVGNGTSYGLDKSFATSQAGAAEVSIVPSNQTVYPGGSFNINVMVDSAGIPLTACDVAVFFDTDLVATGLTGADLLGTFGLDALYLPTIDIGEAGYGGVRTDGPIAVNGNFVTINFVAGLFAAGTYPLVVEATLLDAGGNSIAVVENDGQVNIGTNGRKGDFDGNGNIDFFDFYQFCSAYGSELGDPNYNVIGDFDDNGDIGFLDFYGFCNVYGT